MIFASYSNDNKEYIGIVSKDKKSITPFESMINYLNIDLPLNMNKLIEIFDKELHEDIKQIVERNTIATIPLNQVNLISPIPYPKRNVICLGKNYVDHATEIKSLPGAMGDVPDHPIYFSKMAYPAIGDKSIILNHNNYTQSMDYEVELVVIIGKEGRDIKPEDAEDYIFGYSIGNDISIRNMQKNHIQWLKGKSMDTCCSIGPYIIYKDEISFPINLDIQSKINGEIRQNSNTSKMIFDLNYIISDLSKGLTLIPGDIIMTGTPAGVGMGFDPPRMLRPGDKIECIIENIGTLRNYVEK